MSSTSETRPEGSSRGVTVVALGLLVGIFYVLGRRGLQPLTNPDTFFHLRFGEEFLSGAWSLRDPGSVSTFATEAWLPTQWLPQVAMAWLEQHVGLAGVAWFATAMFCALGLAVYGACRREASPTIATFVTLLTVAACWAGLSARPQVLSYVLAAVVTSAWLATSRDGRVRWWLVPVAWLWATLHGMWPVGLLLGGAAVLGMLLDRRQPRRVVLGSAGVVLASALASALTPLGPGLYGAVIGVGDRAHFFTEWRPAQLIVSVFTPALVLLVLLLVLRLRRPMTWTETLLALNAVVWLVYAMRTVPAAAVILAPLVAGALQTLLPSREPVGRLERTLVPATALGTLAVVTALLLASPHRADPTQPAFIDEALAAQPAGTPVLDDWGWGGYLMWRYPGLDLMMHGYGDTFTLDELQANQDIITLQPGWQAAVDDSGARIAVLDPGSPLAYALAHDQGWRELGADDEVVVLEAPPGWTAAD